MKSEKSLIDEIYRVDQFIQSLEIGVDILAININSCSAAHTLQLTKHAFYRCFPAHETRESSSDYEEIYVTLPNVTIFAMREIK